MTLTTWLERFPPQTKYDFGNEKTCLGAQYLVARGFSLEGDRPPISKLFGGIERYHAIAKARPHTFGAARDRAKRYRQ